MFSFALNSFHHRSHARHLQDKSKICSQSYRQSVIAPNYFEILWIPMCSQKESPFNEWTNPPPFGGESQRGWASRRKKMDGQVDLIGTPTGGGALAPLRSKALQIRPPPHLSCLYNICIFNLSFLVTLSQPASLVSVSFFVEQLNRCVLIKAEAPEIVPRCKISGWKWFRLLGRILFAAQQFSCKLWCLFLPGCVLVDFDGAFLPATTLELKIVLLGALSFREHILTNFSTLI